MQASSVTLEARNPDRRHFRSYKINVDLDLFGAWIIQIRFGRIGCAGTLLTYSAPDEDSARKLVRQCLARRRGAPKRLGVPYQVTNISMPGDWLK